MKKGVLIIIIVVLVIAELFTIGFYNESRNDYDALQDKVELKEKEIEKLTKEVTQLRKWQSTDPKDLFDCAREAYVKKDGDLLATIYRKYESLPIIDEGIENTIFTYVKSLNKEVDSKALKDAAREVEKKEAAYKQWKSSKEYKAQESAINDLIPIIVQARQREEALEKKYGEKNVKDAKEGIVKVGFTMELVESALGAPKSKTSYTSSNGTTERWFYDGKKSYDVISFFNGKVESFIKSE